MHGEPGMRVMLLLVASFAPGFAAGAPGAQSEVEFARGSIGSADFGAARLSGTEHRIAFRAASRPAGDYQFHWGLDYAYHRYEYAGLPGRNRDLHRVELPFVWRGEAAYSWAAELRPVIAASSNVFKELWSRGSSDDVMWHGGVTLGRAPVGMAWGWRVGAARDDAFGRERVYPAVAVLRQREGARIELGWPVSRALLEAGRGLELGGELGPAGARWHVVSDERDGAGFDYEARAWRAGAVLRARLAGGLSLATRAGLEFERRHRLEDDTGAVVNRAVGEATFFELSVGYRW